MWENSMKWQPIETAPRNRQMVLVIGDKVNAGHMIYTTDMYCVWFDDRGEICARWPHKFMPTHWMPLPSPPNTGEKP